MNEIMIKRHSFDVAKNRLKEFSERTEAELEIDKVRTDGGFLGLGDHKVTGYELNRRLETIQDNFIVVNTTNNKVIKEFREVYNALDALDKDYITSIVHNVKAIEKTSNDVRVQQGTLKQHHERLERQQNKLDIHQTEIEKYVASIKKIVNSLKIFKEKLEGYKHLTDIDKVWNDCRNIQNRIEVVSQDIKVVTSRNEQDIKAIEEKLTNIEKDIIVAQNEISEISNFTNVLKNYIHLKDVDMMWDSVEICKDSINTLNSNVSMHQNDIRNLFDIHENTNVFINENRNFICENERNIGDLLAIVKNNKNEVEKEMKSMIEATNQSIESLKKNNRLLFWIAGSSVALAIVELFILISVVM